MAAGVFEYDPAGQLEQVVAPAGEYVPGAHGVRILVPQAYPAGHDEIGVGLVAPDPEYVFVGFGVHVAAPPVEYVPAGHITADFVPHAYPAGHDERG